MAILGPGQGFPRLSPSKEAPAPETPSKAGRSNEVGQYLQNFCRQFDIELPLNDRSSPSTRQNTVQNALLNKIRLLCWRHQHILDQTVLELHARQPQVRSLPANVKLEALNSKFAEALTAASPVRNPQPLRSGRRSPDKLQTYPEVLANGFESDGEDPPSPTLAVKHMPARAASLLSHDQFRIPSPVFAQSAATSFDSAVPILARSAATSFDSAMTKSFTSNTTNLSRVSANTAATSIFDEYTDTQYGPSFDLSTTPPRAPAAPQADTPSKKLQPWQITRIPEDGLSQYVLPARLLRLPFFLRCEALRIMRKLDHGAIRMLSAMPGISTLADLHEVVDELDTNGTFRRSEQTDFEDKTLRAAMHFTGVKNKVRFFDFELLTPQGEEDGQRSSYQRKYGGDRVLIVDLADFKKPPEGFDRDQVKDRFIELVSSRRHSLLGRVWEVFLIQDKKRKGAAAAESNDLGNLQAQFFAVSGDGIPTVCIEEFVEWWIPYEQNHGQKVCKVFSRLDLGASKSKSTVTFMPEQINYDIDDLLATDEPELADGDPDDDADRFDGSMVMNDGASLISVTSMNDIRNAAGLAEMPSAFQARFCGAKGLFIRDRGLLTLDPSESDRWANLHHSQVKIRHKIGRGGTTDTEHLTFNIVDYSRPASKSVLYTSFIPILEERGVPRASIISAVTRGLSTESDAFTNALRNPIELRKLIHQERSLEIQRSTGKTIAEVAGFPERAEERICMMLEAGFVPENCRFLANQILDLGRLVLQPKAKHLRSTLNASTLLKGIPDPYGVLEPGEVFLGFSSPLSDPLTGQQWSQISGDVLISRHPGMGSWDVQKARAVVHPELAHLHDVIVFSTRGRRPLASKLSGGDYDGDTFWATWDPELTYPFTNAPAPWVLPRPASFGMEQDHLTVRQLVGEEVHKHGQWTRESALAFIKYGLKHRMKWNALGEITNKHSAVVYKEGSICSEKAELLVALHDLYIDADKQGYDLSKEAWLQFQRKHGFLDRDFPTPPYREFMHKDTKTEAMQALAKEHSKSSNLLDYLCFSVAQPIVDEALKQAETMANNAEVVDNDLTKYYIDVKSEGTARKGSYMATELKALRKKLIAVDEEWYRGMEKWRTAKPKWDPAVWREAASTCRNVFDSIRPEDPNHPTAVEWLRSCGHEPTAWDLLKASALAKLFNKNESKMLFGVTGGEMCILKARATGRARRVLQTFHKQSKPSRLVEGLTGPLSLLRRMSTIDGEQLPAEEDAVVVAEVDSTTANPVSVQQTSNSRERKRGSSIGKDSEPKRRASAPSPGAENPAAEPPTTPVRRSKNVVLASGSRAARGKVDDEEYAFVLSPQGGRWEDNLCTAKDVGRGGE
ncbi:hypothetical protein LTR62_007990 [Meristemomyces frigidus]|uniref:RNA-dependent RNA polymerase n=1 Tax=Meristemomyces frigidus TaxID=1508187 RepID=A0AAN7YT32_9PEZI|nr:hypothetical protein LTR62_007990 [Meristemomyces frigidus]